MLSQEEYLRSLGSVCPHCGSTDVQPGEAEFYPGGLTQECECLTCGKRTRDTYELTGFEPID